MELVEKHAYSSYQKFLKAHKSELKAQPAPDVAVHYYDDGALYMFNEFQTAHPLAEGGAKIDNLYNVFWQFEMMK
jgi:ubiquinol oxidase